ncbi:MAG: histidine kinase [Lachnospiraceae bacterium]|nr:histidine kinase [Lachnospiraceae bacterium]
MIERLANSSIRKKLLLIYAITSVVVLTLNVFVFVNINRLVKELDSVFLSNINIGEFSSSLDKVHTQMLGYLNTKSTDDIYGYYEACQEYESQISLLSDEISSQPIKRMERNIRRMSENYLELTENAIDAKRGRNIEKYRNYFEEADELYGYLKTYINSLNNEYFKNNSADYLVLSNSLNYVEFINMFVFVTVSAVSIILVIILANRVTRPLISLAEVAEKVAEGDYNVRVQPVATMDEIGVLNAAFDRMLTGIKQGILMEMRLREAELKTLQAQINPHFLFNTLNAGAQLAMMEGADRTYTYVQAVADFYRYNVKKTDAPVTLSDEMQMVDTYIYILNIRFSGDVGYEKDIEEELSDVMMPTMTLQPIVENAVNHGIREIMGEGRIVISAKSDGDDCVIKISDNGKGLTPEQVDDILSRRTKMKDEHGGIGLRNVMERLYLMYGSYEVFDVKSDGPDMGTTIILRLPKDGSRRALEDLDQGGKDRIVSDNDM